jgi:hypothetical protein
MFTHMAAAPTTPLPDLPREDRRRLSLFFSCNEDLAALAAALIKELPPPPSPPIALPQSPTPFSDSGLPSSQSSAPSTQHSPPPDLDEFTLQSWLSRPDIAAHIDYRRQEADHRTRQRAISALEDVCRLTKDLIEKRRAASTILRILARTGAPTGRSGGPKVGGFVGSRARNGASSHQFHSFNQPHSDSPSYESSGSSTSYPTSTTSCPDPDDDIEDDADDTEDDADIDPFSAPSRGAAPVHCQGREPLEPVCKTQAPEGRHSWAHAARNPQSSSHDSALSTQSSALPLPYDWSRYTTPHTTPQLQSLSLPSTPDLDAARLAFFAGGDSAIRIITPNSSRLPHPITTPQRVIANVLDALQRDKHAGLITAFNHSGILDRSPDALTTFADAFTADFPHIARSHDPTFRGDKQPSDHEFSCTCSLAYPNFQNHRFTIRCTLHRPTDGPLARCWLLTMKPDTS